jgi:hypothetical protein
MKMKISDKVIHKVIQKHQIERIEIPDEKYQKSKSIKSSMKNKKNHLHLSF